MRNDYDIYSLDGRRPAPAPAPPNFSFIAFDAKPQPDPKSWEGRLLEEVAAAERQLLAAKGALDSVRAAISRANGCDVIAHLEAAKHSARHAEFCMEEAARVAL